MERLTYSPFTVTIFIGVSLLVGGFFGFLGGRSLGLPPSRSAVYEIPMADKKSPWRVTTFQGKVYVLIEAPSMPEDMKRGAPLP